MEPNLFQSFNPYDCDFEVFFREHSILKKTYCNEELIQDPENDKTIGYLYSGYCKLYQINQNGDEIFTGFIPPHTTRLYNEMNTILGKTLMAAGDVQIYFALYSDYLDFLQQKSERITHALKEPLYRRNLNEYPRHESIGQSAKFKTYNYIYFLAQNFGKTQPGKNHYTIAYPPNYRDIASYNGISSNNVSHYLSELKREGIIEYNKKALLLLDLDKLKKILQEIKQ